MINNKINYSKNFLRYTGSFLITLFLFSCSPEELPDIEEEDVENIETEEEETGINDPDIIIDSPTDTDPTREEPNLEIVEENLSDAEALLILVNEVRTEAGLTSLVLNDALTKAALAHSIDMETNDYFDHKGLNGSSFGDRTKDAGYTGSALGENIALGQRNTESVHSAWINSEGHRNNILNSNITEMGLGHSGRYWTQIFGRSK